MGDEKGEVLRAYANTQLRDRWLEIERLTGATDEAGVAEYFGEHDSYWGAVLGDMLPAGSARKKAEEYVARALAWKREALPIYKEVSEAENRRLTATESIVTVRMTILMRGGVVAADSAVASAQIEITDLWRKVKKALPAIGLGLGVLALAVVALLVFMKK